MVLNYRTESELLTAFEGSLVILTRELKNGLHVTVIGRGLVELYKQGLLSKKKTSQTNLSF